MWDMLEVDSTPGRTALVLGLLVTSGVLAWVLRADRREEDPSPWVLALSSLPLVAGWAVGLQQALQLRVAAEGAATLYARVFIALAPSQVTVALSFAVLALTLLAMWARSSGSRGVVRGSMALLCAWLASLAGVSAYQTLQRAHTYDALSGIDSARRVAVLQSAASADATVSLGRWLLLLAGLALSARLLYVLACEHPVARRYVPALVVALLALHVQVAVTHLATHQLVAALAMPWPTDPAFQPVIASDLRADVRSGVLVDPIALVVGESALTLHPAGTVLPSGGPRLEQALVALHQRLSTQREQADAEYWALAESEEQGEPEALGQPEALEEPLRVSLGATADDAADQALARELTGRLGMLPLWPGCEPTYDPDTLVVAVDRRASSETLVALMRAAAAAGFEAIELSGPLVPLEEVAALRARDAAGAAVTAPSGFSIHVTLVEHCATGGQAFYRARVGATPVDGLEHSGGQHVTLLELEREQRVVPQPRLPPVVMTLAPGVTPLALMRAHQTLARLDPAALVLAASFERSPAQPTP